MGCVLRHKVASCGRIQKFRLSAAQTLVMMHESFRTWFNLFMLFARFHRCLQQVRDGDLISFASRDLALSITIVRAYLGSSTSSLMDASSLAYLASTCQYCCLSAAEFGAESAQAFFVLVLRFVQLPVLPRQLSGDSQRRTRRLGGWVAAELLGRGRTERDSAVFCPLHVSRV